MAVSEQTPYKEYTANGSANSFALEFDCENQDHLIVLVDDVEPVVGTWSLIGGAVVFGTAPINGKKITIQRNTPFRRDEDFQSYDNSFRPAPVNKGFDKTWWKIQELGVADWLLGLKIQKFRDDVNLTALENTLEEAKQIRDETADSVTEVQSNVEQSQTLLANTTAQSNLAQGYASSADSANTAAQQAAINVSDAESNVYSALNAQTTTVNTALSNLSTTANKYYSTLAAANADIANIAVNQSVTIGEEANSGLWEKKTVGATSLTKSPYDPIEQANKYTKQSFLNYGLYKSNLPAQFDGAGVLLSYFDENGNLVVSRGIYADGIKLAGLPLDVEYQDGGFPAHIANDNIMPLSFDKMGRLIAIPHPSFAKQVIALTGTSVDLSSVVSSEDIALYGDSLTASGSGYGDLLSAELGGRSVINRGSGGQDTLNIVQRQGGAPINVAAFTMPASGSLTVTLTNGDPYYSKGGTYTAKINDIAITVAPTATQNQWTVTRTSAGAAINVADGSIIILDEQESFRNKTLILQPGPNFGSSAIAPTRQQMRPYLELTSNAIAHLIPKIKKFLIIGDYTPAVSGQDKSKLRDHVVLFNQMLKELVGEAHFVDWHTYSSTQAIYDGIALGLIQSVTAQDIADMNAGFVPNSLTVDGIHANAAFKTLQAKFIAMHIKAKGI